METMKLKHWGRKALTVCSITVLIATYSMVTLAASNKPVGELVVSGNILPDGPTVTVNGEAAKTGRTIFDSSTVVTPESTGALVNLGKAGRIDLAPGTTFVVNVDGDVVSGDLTVGSLTVLSAAESVNVKTLSGETVRLNAGETATAVSGKAAIDHRDPVTGKCIDDDNDGKADCGIHIPWWGWAAIVGGAAVIIIVVATNKNNNSISPIR